MFRNLAPSPILHVPTGNRCNNRCVFCMERNAGYPVVQSLEDYVETLRRMRTELDGVVFTGGEPTLNPLLPELVEAAHALGYRRIGLVTNGRALQDRALCERLMAAGLGEVTVSLHGPNASVHDEITRRRGSFDQAVRGIGHLAELGRRTPLELRVNCSLVRTNLPHLRAMGDFVRELGADHVNFNAVEPRGTADDLFDEVVPSYREVMDAADASELDFFEPSQSLSRVPACAGGTEWVQERWHLAHRADRVDVYDATEGKTKGPPCRRCALASRCEGIWSRYVAGYGWEELQPVAPARPVDGRPWRVRLAAPCNNRCVHCHDGPAAPTGQQPPHVAHQLRVGLLLGYRRVELAGGEPLLLGHLGRLVQLARNLGYQRVGIESNGRALNVPALVDEIAAMGLDEVMIRLNAGDERIHDRMARAPGAFRQTLRGMLRLSRRGIPFAVRLRPHRLNATTVGRARELALRCGARRFEQTREPVQPAADWTESF